MDYQQYAKRDLAEIRVLWFSGYWDGPLDGLLFMDGRKYWYHMVEESKQPHTAFYRRFAIIELTGEQLAEEEKWHQLFQEKVGGHTDYDETGRLKLDTQLPRATHAEFYDPYKSWQQPNYLENHIVGWFEM